LGIKLLYITLMLACRVMYQMRFKLNLTLILVETVIFSRNQVQKMVEAFAFYWDHIITPRKLAWEVWWRLFFWRTHFMIRVSELGKLPMFRRNMCLAIFLLYLVIFSNLMN